MGERRCTLGVGCEEYATCYAAAHGRPDQCGRDEPLEPSGPPVDVEARREARRASCLRRARALQKCLVHAFPPGESESMAWALADQSLREVIRALEQLSQTTGTPGPERGEPGPERLKARLRFGGGK